MSYPIEERLFTAEEYHKMYKTGILEEKGTELLNGKITTMSPIGSQHAACVKRLNAIFQAYLKDKCIISVQDPIHLGNRSEPEPDLALLRPKEDFYADQLPKPEDVLLVVEVADTSADYDREVKLPLYAEAGIPEYWLVSLNDERIEVYQNPKNGNYSNREFVYKNDPLRVHFSEVVLPSEKLF